MDETQFPAHIRLVDGFPPQIQTNSQHCRCTARYAGDALKTVSLEQSAYLAGLLHDMGKTRQRFADYIQNAVLYSKHGSTVNHTFCGVRFLMEQYFPAGDLSSATAELLAYAVGSHHSLFDCLDPIGSQNGFQHRTDAGDIEYEQTLQSYLATCASMDELDTLFEASTQELDPIFARLDELALPDDGDDSEFCFYVGLLARLLLSAVIEGDRRDTAEFMTGIAHPAPPEDMTHIWRTCLQRMEKKLLAFSSDTPICKARQQISDQCRAFAERSGGIYRLSVPTGAGKTLSALRYALAHSARHNKSRIIFTAPLLSILDQNAAVLRDFVGDDSLILEHHSNVVRGEEHGEQLQAELLTESWSAPIIITTLVQLLNTCFDGKTACIRRFHALCNSVIVIDEVQTVPTHMLTQFHLVLNFLAHICGATILLCSATQPYTQELSHPLKPEPEHIIPYQPDLWQAFQRTKLVNAHAHSLEELPNFILDTLDECQSLLVVCNTKAEASTLFHALEDYGTDAKLYHLSAAMCMAHRRTTLAKLKTALDSGEKTICVSTQVIEAGVDISFDCAIRLLAGMDSAVQTAGRCNRHGERAGLSTVYLVQCEPEHLTRLPEISKARQASISLLSSYDYDSAKYDNDLCAATAIQEYYQAFYGNASKHAFDYPLERYDDTLYGLLSENQQATGKAPDKGVSLNYLLNQAFKTAGSLFQVFDADTLDVIVPYCNTQDDDADPHDRVDGEQLILDLCSERAKRDLVYRKELLKRAKLCTISLYSTGSHPELTAICDGTLLVLQEGYYHQSTGFDPKRVNSGYLEV